MTFMATKVVNKKYITSKNFHFHDKGHSLVLTSPTTKSRDVLHSSRGAIVFDACSIDAILHQPKKLPHLCRLHEQYILPRLLFLFDFVIFTSANSPHSHCFNMNLISTSLVELPSMVDEEAILICKISTIQYEFFLNFICMY